MKNETLQYYMHDGSSAFRFELAGDLLSEGARRLERDWSTASSIIGDRILIVDMTFVTSADEEGRALLARWHADGARLIAKSKRSLELAEAIVGQPLPELAAAGKAGADPTWLPFRTSFTIAVLHGIIPLLLVLFPVRVRAASANTSAGDGHIGTLPVALTKNLRVFASSYRPLCWNPACLWKGDRPNMLATVPDSQTKE